MHFSFKISSVMSRQLSAGRRRRRTALLGALGYVALQLQPKAPVRRWILRRGTHGGHHGLLQELRREVSSCTFDSHRSSHYWEMSFNAGSKWLLQVHKDDALRVRSPRRKSLSLFGECCRGTTKHIQCRRKAEHDAQIPGKWYVSSNMSLLLDYSLILFEIA